MRSAKSMMGTRAPQTSADLGEFSNVGQTPIWKKAGYIVKHSGRPGIFGFSEVSRAAAWTDAIGNIATGNELLGLTNFADTARQGDWYVSLVGECSSRDFTGESPASRRLEAEANFQAIIRERAEKGSVIVETFAALALSLIVLVGASPTLWQTFANFDEEKPSGDEWWIQPLPYQVVGPREESQLWRRCQSRGFEDTFTWSCSDCDGQLVSGKGAL